MLFQVTDIQFDFTYDGEDDTLTLDLDEQDDIIGETIGKVWEAENEDDLLEVITDSTGWCILNVEYNLVSV